MSDENKCVYLTNLLENTAVSDFLKKKKKKLIAWLASHAADDAPDVNTMLSVVSVATQVCAGDTVTMRTAQRRASAVQHLQLWLRSPSTQHCLRDDKYLKSILLQRKGAVITLAQRRCGVRFTLDGTLRSPLFRTCSSTVARIMQTCLGRGRVEIVLWATLCFDLCDDA